MFLAVLFITLLAFCQGRLGEKDTGIIITSKPIGAEKNFSLRAQNRLPEKARSLCNTTTSCKKNLSPIKEENRPLSDDTKNLTRTEAFNETINFPKMKMSFRELFDKYKDCKVNFAKTKLSKQESDGSLNDTFFMWLEYWKTPEESFDDVAKRLCVDM